MLVAGIDAGSRAIKIVLLRSQGCELVASGVAAQGVKQEAETSQLLDKLLESRDLQRADVARMVATGYARNLISMADTTVTEITCHARGIHHLMPQARTIIEIGGQDSKVIMLDRTGKVRDFAMNDRCAAGTGRFLEVVSTRLNVPLDALGATALKSRNPALISSMCVVFAETEIIGLLASGTPAADIIAGVQAAIATRVATMAGTGPEPPVVMTGGVAMVGGMPQALSAKLDLPVQTAPKPQLTGALGAALLAIESAG